MLKISFSDTVKAYSSKDFEKWFKMCFPKIADDWEMYATSKQKPKKVAKADKE